MCSQRHEKAGTPFEVCPYHGCWKDSIEACYFLLERTTDTSFVSSLWSCCEH